MYSLEFYLTITGLLLSFFFAGSEIAFTSFNKLRLDVWLKQRIPFAANAARFVKKPEEFFSTILVGNNLANILCTTFATYLLIAFYDETITWLIITAVVLFFGEILPKTLFRPVADKIILKILLLVRLFYFLLKPFITFINYFVERFLGLLRVKHTAVMTYFSRDEMKLLLHEGYGFLRPESEQKYLRNILEFSESRVREAMTPRAEMIAVSQKTRSSQIFRLMAEHRLSRIPIFKNTLDNIIGIVFMIDLLRTDAVYPREIMREVTFVPENKSCLQLLREFQTRNISSAIVLDEYGGTAGIVTVDDLIEELFGEFQQAGELTPQIRALNSFTWLVDARMELEELGELLKIDFPVIEEETLAGFLLRHLGYIPKADEVKVFKNFRIEIVQASPKKIEKVKIILDR